ncbi:MAG: hypothetical protein V3W45_01895, partial [Sedimentisphaerales bacterium]
MVTQSSIEAMLDTVKKSLGPSQLCELEKFGGRINKFGVNFAVCDAGGELVLLCDGGRFKSSREQLIKLSRRALKQNGEKNCSDDTGMPVWRFGDANPVLAAVLKSARVANKGPEAVGVALL